MLSELYINIKYIFIFMFVFVFVFVFPNNTARIIKIET